MSHICYMIDCANNPIYNTTCDSGCYIKYINSELMCELNIICKDLYFTYLLHRYLNIRTIPTVINTHILSFLAYGPNLHRFVEKYLSIYYLQCIDDNYVKSRIRAIMSQSSFRYPKYVRKVSLYIQNILNCISSCAERILNIIPDIEIIVNSHLYAVIIKNDNFKSIYSCINNTYHKLSKKILYKATKNYDNALLGRISSDYVEIKDLTNILHIKDDVWAVINMLHIIHPNIQLEFLYDTMFKQGCISIIKYVIKHFWNANDKKHVLYLISTYGYVELLDELGEIGYDIHNINNALYFNNYNVFIWYYMRYGIKCGHALEMLNRLRYSYETDHIICLNTLISYMYGVNGITEYNLLHNASEYYTDYDTDYDGTIDYERASDYNHNDLLGIDLRDDISDDSQFDRFGDPHGTFEQIVLNYHIPSKNDPIYKFFDELYDELYGYFYDDYIEDANTLYINRKYAHLIN